MSRTPPSVWAALDARRELPPPDTEMDCGECQGTGLGDGPDGPPCVYCDGTGIW